MTTMQRVTVSLPSDLVDWARRTGGTNMSAVIARILRNAQLSDELHAAAAAGGIPAIDDELMEEAHYELEQRYPA